MISLFFNCADDLNNKDLIYSKVIITLRQIASCIDTSYKISLMCHNFISKEASLVTMATKIMGINENQVTSDDV